MEGQPRTWRREAISDYLEGTFGDLGDLPGLSSKASGPSWMPRSATVGSLGAVFESLPATAAVWGLLWGASWVVFGRSIRRHTREAGII